MKTLISIISAVSALALLASCGGGGDDAPAVAAAAPTPTSTTPAPGTTTPVTTTPIVTPGSSAQLSSFAGTWVGCFSEGTTSERETLVFTQQSADTFSAASTAAHYAGAGCTGTVTRTSSESGTVTFTGTKTIGADTVNKFIFTKPGSPPSKNVALVKGTNPVTLTFGKDAENGGVLDAEGYPTTLESNTTGSFSKQ